MSRLLYASFILLLFSVSVFADSDTQEFKVYVANDFQGESFEDIDWDKFMYPLQIVVKKKGYKSGYFVAMTADDIPSWAKASNLLEVPSRQKIGRNVWPYKLDLEDLDHEIRIFKSLKKYRANTKDKPQYIYGSQPKYHAWNQEKLDGQFYELFQDGEDTEAFIQNDKGINYLDNIYVTAKVKDVVTTVVKKSAWKSMNTATGKVGMQYLSMSVQLNIYDIFGESIDSVDISVESDQFVEELNRLDYFAPDAEALYNCLEDSYQKALLKMFDSPEFKEIALGKGLKETESEEEEIVIAKANSYVRNIADAMKATLTISSNDSHGSGFFVSSDGYIVTNCHVINEEKDYLAKLNDGTELPLEIIRKSKSTDLALLKIEVKDQLAFDIMNLPEISIGSIIYAIGTPQAIDLGQTVSKGIISGVRTSDSGCDFIQTDASSNPGNSGGPLLQKNGALMGVVCSKIRGFGIEGLSFAMSAEEILKTLRVVVK